MSPVRARAGRAPYAGWRALGATGLVLPGALGAHTWAGGHVPAWPGLVLLAAVLLGTSRLLLDGRASRAVLLPAVAGAQVCLHTSFVSMSGHAAHASTSGPSPWSGRMLLAHTAVSLLTLVVWRLCERAAATVVRWLAPPASYVAGPVGRRPRTPLRASSTTAVLLLAAPRRGPPGVACHA